MFVPMRSLISWVRKLLLSHPASHRRASSRPSVEELENRLAPAGGLPPGAWPTFEQNDQRTGAVDVVALIAPGPVTLWNNGQFGTEGAPVMGEAATGVTGAVPIYSPANGSVYAYNDVTGVALPVGSNGQLPSTPITLGLDSVLGSQAVDAAEGLFRLAV